MQSFHWLFVGFTHGHMFEKDLKIGFLLDFYGDILTAHKRDVMGMYYNEDFSLAEVSQIVGISRQGVRDLIKKTTADLLFYEEKLGLAKRFDELKASAEKITQLIRDSDIPEELREEIGRLAVLAQ